MGSEKQPHDLAICGARKKSGGVCRAVAGSGTNHTGTGRCRHHGGASNGAPKGNKNALSTGRYESILLDTLDDDEQELFGQVNVDTLALVEEELRIITIRERRMLKRIADLKTAGALTVVEESTETIFPDAPDAAADPSEQDEDQEPEFSDRWASEEPVNSKRTQQAARRSDREHKREQEADQTIVKIKQKRAGTLGQIQQIENDLTAVQARKASLIKMKHDFENPTGARPPLGRQEEDCGGAEVATNGLDDTQRAAGVAALLERARARAAGQLPGAEE